MQYSKVYCNIVKVYRNIAKSISQYSKSISWHCKSISWYSWLSFSKQVVLMSHTCLLYYIMASISRYPLLNIHEFSQSLLTLIHVKTDICTIIHLSMLETTAEKINHLKLCAPETWGVFVVWLTWRYSVAIISKMLTKTKPWRSDKMIVCTLLRRNWASAYRLSCDLSSCRRLLFSF